MPLAHLVANPFQPRMEINEAELFPLIESIRRYGFLGHIEARHDPRDHLRPLQIVFGHRRVEAAKRAGLSTIPVAIVERSDEQMRQITFVENFARQGLTYWEEAVFLATMKEEMRLSVREIADALGVNRNFVQERLSILKLPVGPLRESAQREEIPLSAALYLTQIPAATQADVFEQVRRGELNVSDLRQLRQGYSRQRHLNDERDASPSSDETMPHLPSAPTPPSSQTQTPSPSAVDDARTILEAGFPFGAGQHDVSKSPKASDCLQSSSDRSGEQQPAPRSIVQESDDLTDPPPGRSTTSPLPSQKRIYFDRTIIPRPTGRNYAIDAIEQLEANVFHLRQKLEKADFSELDVTMCQRLERARAKLNETMALFPQRTKCNPQ